MHTNIIKHDFWMIVIWLIAVLADGRNSRKCIGPFAVVVVLLLFSWLMLFMQCSMITLKQ